MDDIGPILFLIIFAISLVGSLIQKFQGTGQAGGEDEADQPERPRASELPAATRRQIYGTGSPRAAEADEDDDDEPVEAIPVHRMRRDSGEQPRPTPPPLRREQPARRDAPEPRAFRATEQAPWRPTDAPRQRGESPEDAERASREAAERARRQRESQRQRARETARESSQRGAARLAEPEARLASNEGRMKAQREQIAQALKRRDEVRKQLSGAKEPFRSAPVKRKPRRSAQLTQLGRLMRNGRAIRTGFIFSEVLGQPKALREESEKPRRQQ